MIITWDNETNAHQDVNPVGNLFDWTVPRVKFSHFIVLGDRGAIVANLFWHGADEIIICRVENGTTLQCKSLSMIERPFRIFYWWWGIPNLANKTICINYLIIILLADQNFYLDEFVFGFDFDVCRFLENWDAQIGMGRLERDDEWFARFANKNDGWGGWFDVLVLLLVDVVNEETFFITCVR